MVVYFQVWVTFWCGSGVFFRRGCVLLARRLYFLSESGWLSVYVGLASYFRSAGSLFMRDWRHTGVGFGDPPLGDCLLPLVSCGSAVVGVVGLCCGRRVTSYFEVCMTGGSRAAQFVYRGLFCWWWGDHIFSLFRD